MEKQPTTDVFDRLHELEHLVHSEKFEILETDDSQIPWTLLVIVFAVLIAAGVMLLLFFVQGNQTVTTTLGTHFQKR